MTSSARRFGYALASLWLAWVVVVGCARPGTCFARKDCCCDDARADAPTSLAEAMPCCRVVTRAVTPRVPVTPSPLAPTLVPVAATAHSPSLALAARTSSAACAVAAPLYRIKCSLLL